ncbi:MAG: nuclear transport factor 2 family protein [Mycobacterium sp.]
MSLTIADRLALSDLVHRYAAYVDDRRFDEVVELFTETAEMHLPEPPARLEPTLVRRGPDGVRAAMAALAALTRTQHEIVGEVYADGPGHATGRIVCVAHHWTRSDDGVTDVVWHLRYDDEYLPTAQGWRIRRRALTLNAIETRPIRKLRD